MLTTIKTILGAIVAAVASTFLSAIRRRRQDEELKQAAKNEVYLEAEKAKNDALESWSKVGNVNRDDLIERLRDGKL